MPKDIEELILEAVPLFKEGVISIDDVVTHWLQTAQMYKRLKVQHEEFLVTIKRQNQTIEQLTHALLAQKSNLHA